MVARSRRSEESGLTRAWPERVSGCNGRDIVAILVVVLIASISWSQAEGTHFSTRQGSTIGIEPSGASLQIPESWVFYGTRREIDSVRNGKGEWNTEYADILNAAIPFSYCSLHTGQFGWNSPSFDTLQMRAYVLDADLGSVRRRIETDGLSAARHLSSKKKFISNVGIAQSDTESWHKILITYDVSYADYGGKANVEFYILSKERWTVALVFMHVESKKNGEEVDRIRRSFSWQ